MVSFFALYDKVRHFRITLYDKVVQSLDRYTVRQIDYSDIRPDSPESACSTGLHLSCADGDTTERHSRKRQRCPTDRSPDAGVDKFRSRSVRLLPCSADNV